MKKAAGSGENRISGNAISKPKENLAAEETGRTRKPEPDVRKQEEGKDSKESGLGKRKPDAHSANSYGGNAKGVRFGHLESRMDGC